MFKYYVMCLCAPFNIVLKGDVTWKLKQILIYMFINRHFSICWHHPCHFFHNILAKLLLNIDLYQIKLQRKFWKQGWFEWEWNFMQCFMYMLALSLKTQFLLVLFWFFSSFFVSVFVLLALLFLPPSKISPVVSMAPNASFREPCRSSVSQFFESE